MTAMTAETIQLHIDKCRSYIDFMLSQQQWSGLTKAEVERWLSNFHDLKLYEKYLVYKLLTNLIYYSEKDVLDVLGEGIHSQLFYETVLSRQMDTNFGLSLQAISNIVKSELNDSRFIPLLDRNAPHESGNYISRLLVQNGLIQPSQSMFLDSIVGAFQNKPFKNLIIVDDCVGSGEQLHTFWTSANISIDGSNIPLSSFCADKNIKAYYLTLFGYDKSISELKDEFKNLKICCVRFLNDSQRVFSKASYIWTNEDERQEAIKLFSTLTSNSGIYFYGYNNLDFAFIMHQTIPDWSLPLFWQENSDWKLLMRRKNSND